MTALDPWHRFVASCLRDAYFGRVRVTGEPLPEGDRPRLVIASHRNGAIDGVQVQRAFPRAQHLVSLQLLRNPVLRVFFTGIPVVRRQDVERYGMSPDRVSDPVGSGVRHLADGGDLVVFPEGTSEWGHAPGRYQRGAARIWCALEEQCVEVDVIPVGLFYGAPDRFRSIAELRVGPPVRLRDRGDAIDPGDERAAARARLGEAHEAMRAALDAVSVRCPDPATFDAVQSAAVRRARSGESFASAFLVEQQRVVEAQRRAIEAGGAVAARDQADPPAASAPSVSPSSWPRRIGLALMWLFAPVLLAGFAIGRRADARNTVTLFRMLGGGCAAALWIPAVVVIACFWPWPVLVGVAMAVAGWLLLGARRWHPDPEPLEASAAPDSTPAPTQPEIPTQTPTPTEGERHA
ncbi:MAG: hypothetical protein QM606_07060 [Leucobacter sp.]